MRAELDDIEDDIEDDIAEAAQRYADYHDEDATEIQTDEMPEVAFMLGELDAITYTIVENGEEKQYQHDFETPPGLAISSDGSIAIILAGEWSFTKRGFEG